MGSVSCVVLSLVLGIWCFSLLPCAGQKPADARSTTTIDPAEAENLGRELAAQLRGQKPGENSSTRGWLKIRNDGGKLLEVPANFQIIITPTNWLSVYETTASSNRSGTVKLTVVCADNQPNQYLLCESSAAAPRKVAGNEAMIPFAGSDFWLADFGREFLYWPKQRLLRKQVHRSRSCQQLESINPAPVPGGYARVLSWIDTETGGIMDAEAFDARGDTIKRFSIRGFKKVRGQYELEEMEISNRKTGSRTRIEFDLK
ncbi:MAG: hypothetical protein QOJ40_1099 [Verrucomicrobiota bacterium]